MSTETRRLFPPHRTATAVLLLALVGGCSSHEDDPPAEPVPSPSGKVGAWCRDLHTRLPDSVDGQRRVASTPDPKYAAEWGDPAIRLRCGVSRPAVLTPGSEDYNPTADAVEVNGVSWLLEPDGDGYRFTSTERAAWVEVTVPDAYAPEVNALTDLADAVRAAVPEKH